MINIESADKADLWLSVNVKEANLGNAEEFKTELIKLFNEHRKRIILNLEKVEYVDSSFLGALVSSLKYVISFQSDIILVGMRKDISDLFTLIRLDKVFKIHPGFSEAANS